MLKLILSLTLTCFLCTTASAYTFTSEEDSKKTREDKLEAYLSENPDMVAVVERLMQSYYVDLTNFNFVLAESAADREYYKKTKYP